MTNAPATDTTSHLFLATSGTDVRPPVGGAAAGIEEEPLGALVAGAAADGPADGVETEAAGTGLTSTAALLLDSVSRFSR